MGENDTTLGSGICNICHMLIILFPVKLHYYWRMYSRQGQFIEICHDTLCDLVGSTFFSKRVFALRVKVLILSLESLTSIIFSELDLCLIEVYQFCIVILSIFAFTYFKTMHVSVHNVIIFILYC